MIIGENSNKTSGIYLIMNNVGESLYVGQSKNVFSRWREHYKEAMANKENDNSILHKAIRKHGINSFWFKVIEICNEDELDEKERFYIQLYEANCAYGNYNIKPGGSGGVSIGSRNHNSKLTEKDVFNIREAYGKLERWRDVYARYSTIIGESTFKDIWTGKTWKHVHMDVYTEEIKNKQRNNYDKIESHKSFQVVTDDEIRQIREMKRNGKKPRYVYNDYFSHINRNTFNDVWYGHTFKHIKVKE